jgi:hypothetical protein
VLKDLMYSIIAHSIIPLTMEERGLCVNPFPFLSLILLLDVVLFSLYTSHFSFLSFIVWLAQAL